MLRSFGEGQILVREGEPAQAIYVILTGGVRVFRSDRQSPGSHVELARLGTGDVIGELAPILGKVRSATVEALEPTQTLEIPVSQLHKLMKEHPGLERVIVEALRDRSGLADPEIGELAAAAGLALPVQVDYDSNIVYPKRVVCPVCRAAFSALTVHVRKDQPTARESDFHNTYATPYNPYDYEPWVCPSDLYAGLPADFEGLRDFEGPAVARAIEEVVASWGDEVPPFNGERSLELRERALELALAIYQARELPPLRLAAVLHRLAWVGRERGDTVAEAKWLEQALDKYTSAFQEAKLGNTKEELRVQYLCGELRLRLGDVAGAVNWFSQALRDPAVKKHPTWERLLREQWSVARQERKPAPLATD